MVGRTLPFGFNMASQDALDDLTTRGEDMENKNKTFDSRGHRAKEDMTIYLVNYWASFKFTMLRIISIH